MSETQFEELRERMLRQSFLFDDPYSYRCGVEDAVSAMRAAMATPAPAERAGDMHMAAAG